MKYKSMGEAVRIASTSGHIIMVGDEFINVPSHMEAEARALGCVSEEIFNKIQSKQSPVNNTPPAGSPPPEATPSNDGDAPPSTEAGESGEFNTGVNIITSEQRVASIVASIKAMAEENFDKNFTNAGLPNMRILKNREELPVVKEDFDKAWAIVQDEVTSGGDE